MPKITIAGAGIIGLSIACQLPRDYEVTIVASILPGDPDTTEWASPWAGGIWMPVHGSNAREQELQLNAYTYLRNLAFKNPESGVRMMEMDEILDYEPEEPFWFHDRLPGFRVLSKSELPEGASYGMTYQSLTITPNVLIQFLRKRLEASGVVFKRVFFKALSDLKGMGHDVLINATGLGSRKLLDVRDTTTEPTRSQTILVRTPYNKILMRHGKDYSVPFTYVIPRHDNTAILGGLRDYGATDASIRESDRQGIFERVHRTLPNDFPAQQSQFDVVRDIVGIHPMRATGTIVEKQIMDGQKVVHAYGTMSGGYIYSFGVGREAARKVNEFLFAWSLARL